MASTKPNGVHDNDLNHANEVFKERYGDKTEPIAIIGLDVKFPQDATTPEKFWQMLMEKRSAMTEIPYDRFNIDAFCSPEGEDNGSLNIRGGHFIKEDIASFDAPFFSVSVEEASSMDPQQRKLLETTFRAMENAGIKMESARGSNTSVFIGSFTNDYNVMMRRDMNQKQNQRYQAVGNHSSLLANRLSWFYDLKGPSLVIDTACSSSLNAVHVACQNLRSGESNMSIVGGSNLFFDPDGFQLLAKAGFLSPDSVCYSFDERANGYARGEGFGVIILKPLSNALRDNDTIRAVIRASGANQDGRTPGLTQPSSIAQERLIHDTYELGGLKLSTTKFIEAHGTGTVLGDLTEAKAIGSAFHDRASCDPIYIGAVKSNIGHLEGASGIAGLIKTVLVLEHGIIPPNTWFKKLNSKIAAENFNIKFPVEPTLWGYGLRRASINSFGFGGANCHVVLDDAYNYLRLRNLEGRHVTVQIPSLPPPAGTQNSRTNGTQESKRPRLFVWSAADESGLTRQCESYLKHLSDPITAHVGEGYLADLAWTLSDNRSRLPWKSFVVAHSVESLREKLSAGFQERARSYTEPLLVFLFTGQGAHWHAMGRELLKYGRFAQSLEEATRILHNLGCPWSIISELQQDKSTSKFGEATYSQPICTALQIALVELLGAWEIHPDKVLGHSSGEIAAAYCIGGITKASALKVAYFRGIVSQSLSETNHDSGMMAIGCSEQRVASYLQVINGSLVVACINSPTNVTVSGNGADIGILEQLLKRDGVFTRILPVNIAYHSPEMHKVAGRYRSMINDLSEGTFPSKACFMISSVTGLQVSLEELRRAEYWVNNLISPVRFAEAFRKIHYQAQQSTKMHYLLEVGPHSALCGPVRECLSTYNTKDGRATMSYDSVLVRGKSASDTILSAAGKLYCAGVSLRISVINKESDQSPERSLVTNLPSYPFNPTTKYWCEGRISKSYRFCQYPYNELLGRPVQDWNPLNARWQNTLRLSETSWFKDHVVNQAIIYPAAGLLLMGIEGALQLCNKQEKTICHILREVRIRKALIVPQGKNGVEIQVHLRPLPDMTDASVSWFEFQIYAYDESCWSEICEGQVGLKYRQDFNSFLTGEEFQEYFEAHRDGAARCQKTISSDAYYSHFNNIGFEFGPGFQTLKNIRFNALGEATTTVNLRQWKENTPSSNYALKIHPICLDSMFQSPIPALIEGLTTRFAAIVPTFIDLITIHLSEGACCELGSPHAQMEVFSKANIKGLRNAECTFAAHNVGEAHRGSSVTMFGKFQVTASASANEHCKVKDDVSMCSYIDWKPDIRLLSHSKIQSYCATKTLDPTSVQALQFKDIRRLNRLVCFVALKRLGNWKLPHSLLKEKPYLQNYIQWVQYQLHTLGVSEHVHDDSELATIIGDRHAIEKLHNIARESSKEGELAVHVSDNLERILNGDEDALEVLFRGSLMEDFYEALHSHSLALEGSLHYIDLLAHKRPGARILEIGGGTGGATKSILQTLTAHGKGGARFSKYVFTDISPSFFESARERFSAHQDLMDFKVLDIDSNPIKQGFEEHKYDIIIASSVLHATPCLHRTLEHTRMLLAPGGKLVLFELTVPTDIMSGFIFGLLPGWWLGTEKERKWGPLITTKQWNHQLLKSNFSGVDFTIPAKEDLDEPFTCLVSTATEEAHTNVVLPKTVIVINSESTFQNNLTSQLMTSWDKISSCELVAFNDLLDVCRTNTQEMLCLFLPEIEESILHNITPQHYANLQSIVSSFSHLVWIGKTNETTFSNPTEGMAVGLLRNIQAEFDEKVVISIVLQQLNNAESAANHILSVLQNLPSRSTTMYEPEYREIDSRLCINRLLPSNDLNQHLIQNSCGEYLVSTKLRGTPNKTLSLKMGSPGLLDTFRFEYCPNTEHLGSDYIQVEVKAAGVNFKDVLVSLGLGVGKDLGIECSGVVTRADSNKIYSVGDRVSCFMEGTMATSITCHIDEVCKIPDSMSFQTAAAFPCVLTTAYYSIHHLARLRPGESILIHSVSGGLGQACIQLAKRITSNIFVTVGNEEKKRYIMENFEIPKDRIFSSRNVAFASKIQQITKGRGVNVIINSLGGEALKFSWGLISDWGRFIEVGKKDIVNSGHLPMGPFSRGASFTGVDLIHLRKNDKPQFNRLLKEVCKLLENGNLTIPSPLHVFDASEIEKAFRLLESGKSIGKTVVTLGDEDIVKVLATSTDSYTFKQDATYVIAGGLGGLGMSIARWMTSRGAKNLILLTRTQEKIETNKEFIEDFSSKGVRIEARVCDISRLSDLSSTLEACQRMSLPPIKGCIQSAMLLKDRLFSNMRYEEFQAVINPKVQGSWNLHSLLPSGMDFFVLLASLSGICGLRGQANYACGNTYQDALARFRVIHGEKAVSLDLPSIGDVGYVANRQWIDEKAKSLGYGRLEERELHTLLNYYCDPNLPLDVLKSQVVIGIQSPTKLRAESIEVPAWLHRPMFQQLHCSQDLHGLTRNNDTDAINLMERLKHAKDNFEAVNIIVLGLSTKLARTLAVAQEDINSDRPVHSYGVDSLSAVEIRTWFRNQLNADMSVFDILGNSSIRELAVVVASKSQFLPSTLGGGKR